MTRALVLTAALAVSTACTPAHLATWSSLLDLPADPHDPAHLALAADAWCLHGAALVDMVGTEAVDAMPREGLPACTVGEVLDRAAAEFGVDRALLDSITWCESRHDPAAVNPTSGALGLGQHLGRFWPGRAAAIGLPADADPLDAQNNARVTAWLLSVEGTAPWRASRGCWS